MTGLTWWVVVAVVAAALAALLWFGVLRAADRPINIVVRMPPPPVANPEGFNDTIAKGDFGEILTTAIMTTSGWVQIPSKVRGNHGIDGLFIRKGEKGTEVRIVESKVDQGKLAPGQMSDQWVDDNLVALEGLGMPSNDIAEIRAALARRSAWLRKEVWTYDLYRGRIEIYLLDRDGRQIGSTFREEAREPLVGALFSAIRAFDRENEYTR
ncbi:MAG: hypothetical protein HOP13_01855 [Alphaproteobacteria bacterium]|nr:hypothetical protein [Alphaproteobacteria bacterium]